MGPSDTNNEPDVIREAELAAYVADTLDAAARADLERRLDQHPEWLGVVAALARQRSQDVLNERAPTHAVSSTHSLISIETLARLDEESILRLTPGTRLGRYRIEAPLGRGGMGAVYAAEDPELGRAVAIKLLHTRDPESQRRLVFEARALAKLDDPNVISIYDVGRYEERVFLVMERIHGRTLDQWRHSDHRTWQDVLRHFIAAGRGLAAAHAHGLVHRDFKPTNVMVTDDGRVVVLDFGLARVVADATSVVEPDAAPSEVHTRPAGTMRYMAPEQRRGQICAAASDQYSFCVALYESLWGHTPEASGQTYPRLMRAPPSWVDRVLQRGLCDDAAQRHPSMTALLARLEPPHTRRWTIGAATLFAAGIVALKHFPEENRCVPPARLIAGMHDAALSASVASKSDLLPLVEDYLESWSRSYEDVCDQHGPSEHRPERIQCLDRKLRSLHALLEQQSSGSTTGRDPATSLRNLGSAEECVDLHRTKRRPQDSELIQVLARMDALHASGEFEESIAVSRTAIEMAVARGDLASEAEARLGLGWALAERNELNDLEAAERELWSGLKIAESERLDYLIGPAWGRLTWVVGYRMGRHDEGRRIGQWARAWYEHVGHKKHLAALERTLGGIEYESGNRDAAWRHFNAALEAYERLPDTHPDRQLEIGLTLWGIGATALARMEYDVAEDALRRAVELTKETYPPNHPTRIVATANLAAALQHTGKLVEIRDQFRTLRADLDAASDTSPWILANILQNAAIVELDLGALDEAEYLIERSLAIYDEIFPNHPTRTYALLTRGELRTAQGRLEEATDDISRVVDERHNKFATESEPLADALVSLADVHLRMDRVQDARVAAQEAVDILSHVESRPSSRSDHARTLLAQALARDGDPIAALAVIDASTPLFEGSNVVPLHAAQSALRWARAFAFAGQRQRANHAFHAAWDACNRADDPSAEPFPHLRDAIRAAARELRVLGVTFDRD